MHILRTLTGIGVVAALSATAIAADKLAPIGTGEATIYRDTGHAGPALYVNKAQPNLKLSWPVRSIRVRSGTWELCARTNYRSPCIRVAADEPDISGRLGRLSMMQSMRPLGVQPEVPAPPAGTSLRGMSAEFFPAPGRDGLRILSCAGGGSAASCAARTADEFCRSAGWNGSKSESQQTLDGRVYLADVFCVRSGY